MIHDFVTRTGEFLKRDGLQLQFPEIVPVKREENGRHTTTIFVHSVAVTEQSIARDNLIFSILVFFGYIDAIIDMSHPSLEGKNFSSRYGGLPSEKDKEIIFREIYRIIRIIRNAIVHKKSGVVFSNGCVKFNDRDALKITIKGLDILYSAILFYAKKMVSDEYHVGILRTYYYDIQNEIASIKDVNGNRLDDITGSLRLQRTRRYRVANQEYERDANHLKIKKYEISPGESFASAEYSLSVNNLNYIVPDEALSVDGEISVDELEKWEIASE